MIVSVGGVYSGTKDLVEVHVHLLDDDGTTSLHRLLKEAVVTLLHNRNPMQTIDFDRRAYNKKWNQFYAYFLSPPTQRHMQLQLDVELTDGRTAKVTAPVQAEELLRNAEQLQNPTLSGRPVANFNTGSGFELL